MGRCSLPRLCFRMYPQLQQSSPIDLSYVYSVVRERLTRAMTTTYRCSRASQITSNMNINNNLALGHKRRQDQSARASTNPSGPCVASAYAHSLRICMFIHMTLGMINCSNDHMSMHVGGHGARGHAHPHDQRARSRIRA